MPLIEGSSIWEYQSTSNIPPSDPNAVSVPISGWISGGVMPFGDGTVPSELDTPVTLWAVTTGLWLRRYIALSKSTEILFSGRIEREMYLYIDGVFVGSFSSASVSGDASEFRIVVPSELVSVGLQEIAILCLDNGVSDFSFVSVEVDYLPVVFSLQPEAPVIETLEWLTDVDIAYDGTEQRLKIRNSPRHKIKSSYPASYDNKMLGQNLLRAGLDDKISLPIWTQGVNVGSVAPGLMSVSVDTTKSEFYGPGVAILWESTRVWQVVGIAEVLSNSLTICNPTKAFNNAWVMPLRSSFIPNSLEKSLNGYNATFSAELQLLDNRELTVSAPDQYKAKDVYLEPGLLETSSTKDEIMNDLHIFDPEIGRIEFYSHWSSPRNGRTHRIVNVDRTELWETREFLHRRAGRYREFWQPTFEDDLSIKSSGILGSTISIRRDGYMRGAMERNHLAIETKSGWLLREILSVSGVDEDTMQMTLDTSLGIAKDAIRRVCWLGLNRLDTDSIEIKHHIGGYSTLSFRILEIET